jgi:hypothetical protein
MNSVNLSMNILKLLINLMVKIVSGQSKSALMGAPTCSQCPPLVPAWNSDLRFSFLPPPHFSFLTVEVSQRSRSSIPVEVSHRFRSPLAVEVSHGFRSLITIVAYYLWSQFDELSINTEAFWVRGFASPHKAVCFDVSCICWIFWVWYYVWNYKLVLVRILRLFKLCSSLPIFETTKDTLFPNSWLFLRKRLSFNFFF